MVKMTRCLVSLASVLMILLTYPIKNCDGFVATPSFTSSAHSFRECPSLRPRTALNMAKKRRRKNQSTPSPPPPSPQVGKGTSLDDDLPDFDFDDGTSENVKSPNKIPERTGPAKNFGDVTVNELLSDRSLESKMKFDEPEMDLPDLSDFRNAPAEIDGSPAMGKKRARAEARRAAAVSKKEEEGGGLLSSLPFIGDSIGDSLGEDGKVKPLKVRCRNLFRVL